jgi:hypothetical protein
MGFWQDWFCRRCDGAAEPMAATAAHGWPEVKAGSWLAVRAQFAAGLERAVALAERRDRPIEPPYRVGPPGSLLHRRRARAHRAAQLPSSRSGDSAAADDGTLAATGRELDLVSATQLKAFNPSLVASAARERPSISSVLRHRVCSFRMFVFLLFVLGPYARRVPHDRITLTIPSTRHRKFI